MTEEEGLSATDVAALATVMGNQSYAAAAPDGKHNVHTFFHNVVTADDTTKLGNLREEEIGLPENPIRALKNLSLFARDIMGEPELAQFMSDKSEIITATSLSRNALLLRLAVTQKRELADVTKNTQPRKGGLFSKKEKPEGESEQ